MDYSEVRKAARQAFEKKIEATGLNVWPCRSGYTVSGWGNQGRDIGKALEAEGLSYDRNLSGTFIVSSGPMEQAAIQQAYDMANPRRPEAPRAPVYAVA